MPARVPRLDSGPTSTNSAALGREAAKRVAAAPPTAADTPAHVDPEPPPCDALTDYLFRDKLLGNYVQSRTPQQLSHEVLDAHASRYAALVYWKSRGELSWSPKGITSLALPRACPARVCAYLNPAGGSCLQSFITTRITAALLSEDACRELLRRHVGEDAVWDAHLAGRATKPQILARMLLNLKRVYVRMYSFPQARDATELLLAVDPSARNELRDRGLLAYHLNDFSGALRDLQAYLQLGSMGRLDEEEREEQAQNLEHVKSLRRRVASLN